MSSYSESVSSGSHHEADVSLYCFAQNVVLCDIKSVVVIAAKALLISTLGML